MPFLSKAGLIIEPIDDINAHLKVTAQVRFLEITAETLQDDFGLVGNGDAGAGIPHRDIACETGTQIVDEGMLDQICLMDANVLARPQEGSRNLQRYDSGVPPLVCRRWP